MGRLKKSNRGFTLAELIIAVALSAVVLLAASNLMINFGRFSSNVVRSEASLMGTALGAFEEIVQNINEANQVTIPSSKLDPPVSDSIDIRISPTGGPASASHNFDTTLTYWLNVNSIRRTGAPDDGEGTIIAEDVVSLTFQALNSNNIVVTLEAAAASGPKGELSRERLQTTAVMRSRRADSE